MQRLPHDAHCFGAIHRDHDEVNQDDVHFCPFRQQIPHLLEGSGSVVRFVETAVTGDHLRRTLQNAPHNLPIQPGVVLQPHIIAINHKSLLSIAVHYRIFYNRCIFLIFDASVALLKGIQFKYSLPQ